MPAAFETGKTVSSDCSIERAKMGFPKKTQALGRTWDAQRLFYNVLASVRRAYILLRHPKANCASGCQEFIDCSALHLAAV